MRQILFPHNTAHCTLCCAQYILNHTEFNNTAASCTAAHFKCTLHYAVDCSTMQYTSIHYSTLYTAAHFSMLQHTTHLLTVATSPCLLCREGRAERSGLPWKVARPGAGRKQVTTNRPPASCFLPPASCILPFASCLLCHASCLLPPACFSLVD